MINLHRIGRLNGIGVTLLGVNHRNRHAEAFATLWVTFLYLPLLPLARYHVQFLSLEQRVGSTRTRYQILQRTPLKWTEIGHTYLFGWVLYPLLAGGPMILGVTEIWQGLGLPSRWQLPYVLVAIAWAIFITWKLMDRFEANRAGPQPHSP